MNYNFKLYKNNCLYNNKHAEEVKKRQAQGGRSLWEKNKTYQTARKCWQVSQGKEG